MAAERTSCSVYSQKYKISLRKYRMDLVKPAQIHKIQNIRFQQGNRMRKHHLEHPRNDKSLIWSTGGDANIKTHFACRVKAVTDMCGSKFSPLPAALLMLEGDPPVVHCWQFECTVTCSQAAAALQCRDSTGSRVGERKACQRFGALLARQ